MKAESLNPMKLHPAVDAAGGVALLAAGFALRRSRIAMVSLGALGLLWLATAFIPRPQIPSKRRFSADSPMSRYARDTGPCTADALDWPEALHGELAYAR